MGRDAATQQEGAGQERGSEGRKLTSFLPWALIVIQPTCTVGGFERPGEPSRPECRLEPSAGEAGLEVSKLREPLKSSLKIELGCRNGECDLSGWTNGESSRGGSVVRLLSGNICMTAVALLRGESGDARLTSSNMTQAYTVRPSLEICSSSTVASCSGSSCTPSGSLPGSGWRRACRGCRPT